MTFTMPYNFGDVLLVRFPFTNQVASKQRPAVVVSNLSYNFSRPDVVIMAITSQMRSNPTLGEMWIQDWRSANLLKPSAVKPVFMTLEQGLVLKTLGAFEANDKLTLRNTIQAVLG